MPMTSAALKSTPTTAIMQLVQRCAPVLCASCGCDDWHPHSIAQIRAANLSTDCSFGTELRRLGIGKMSFAGQQQVWIALARLLRRWLWLWL